MINFILLVMMMTPLSSDQKDEQGIKLSKITEINKIYLKPLINYKLHYCSVSSDELHVLMPQ